jgi:hypothetical protein
VFYCRCQAPTDRIPVSRAGSRLTWPAPALGPGAPRSCGARSEPTREGSGQTWLRELRSQSEFALASYLAAPFYEFVGDLDLQSSYLRPCRIQSSPGLVVASAYESIPHSEYSAKRSALSGGRAGRSPDLRVLASAVSSRNAHRLLLREIAPVSPESSPPWADRPLDLAPRLPLGDRLALVVLLLAARQAEIDLGQAPTDDQPERHERIPTLFQLAAEIV